MRMISTAESCTSSSIWKLDVFEQINVSTIKNLLII